MEDASMRLEERLLTPEEVRTLFKLPLETLAARRYRNVGPKYVKVGHLVRYRLRDLDEYLKRNECAIAAEG
jgi:hypothetical protein